MGGQLKYENLFSLYFVFKIFLVWIERGRASEGRAGGAARRQEGKNENIFHYQQIHVSLLFFSRGKCASLH